MDYYVKKAVEVVKKRRRSREEVEEEVSVEQSESVGPEGDLDGGKQSRR